MKIRFIWKFVKKLYKSIWLFPAICLLGLFIFTIFRISGSSVGYYYKNLYGGQKDPHTIGGISRAIRGDEWEWNTSMTIAQSRAGYPKINHNLGNGQDMAVIIDVPYKDWSVLFKPQNLIFFVLPFEYAFAFKWWFLSVILAIAVYFFVLELLPGRRMLAALLAIGFIFSPFIQWWYQATTIVTLATSLLIAIAAMHLLKSNKPEKYYWTIALAYLLSVFALVLYPPFQIPCAIVTAFFILGYIWQSGYFKKKLFNTNLPYFIMAAVLFSVIITTFFLTNRSAINAITNTVYPGHRSSPTGDVDAQYFFSNFLLMPLQFSHASAYLMNQSEASNFILLVPFLIIPILYLALRFDKKQSAKYVILMSVIFVLFLVKLFVPKTDFIFRMFGLNIVPNPRLFIGLGLLNLIFLVLTVRISDKIPIKKLKWPAIMTASAAIIINLILGVMTRQDHPVFLPKFFMVIFFAIIPALAIYFFLMKKPVLAAAILAVFSIMSAGAVHPLYIGAGPIYNSQLIKAIKYISENDKNAKWVVVGDNIYENVALMANAKSLTGTYSYPQNNLWSSNIDFANQPDTYNRFAHIFANFSQDPVRPYLRQADTVELKGSPCSEFYNSNNAKYFLAEKDYSQEYNCLSLNKKIDFPSQSFYILQSNK